jgi:flagellar hook assembly protein FlgD
VDPDDVVGEQNESDNTDSLSIGMVDQVPWVWQEVNGYCHYAAQTMLFNFYGPASTVYETLELASCPYSVCYQDNWLGMMAGWGVCQAISDIEYAGQLRNLSTDLDIGPSWSYYLTQLRMRIDAGIPFETSVDPYYLPQPDYDICRTYGLHSGHAVVVVGYTDDAVIFNDPGVGLDLILEPPIPNPENRGANVIASMESFRSAVEWTMGSSYLLLSYEPTGSMPSHQEMFTEVLPRSLDRLDGYAGVYDPHFSIYYDVFGAPCFAALSGDVTQQQFEAVFDAVMSVTGGNLEAALNTLAGGLDLWGCGICWNGAAVFYGSQSYPQAARLSELSSRLSSYGDQASDEYLDLLEALYDNGGDTGIAGSYLSRMQVAVDHIAALEDSVRIELADLLGSLTEVPATGVSAGLPADPGLACYPNPFNGRTVIRFQLPQDGPVRLVVYNLLGQTIRQLELGHRPSGSHQSTWDGRDDCGSSVASGLYFCRLETPGLARTAKMLLLR